MFNSLSTIFPGLSKNKRPSRALTNEQIQRSFFQHFHRTSTSSSATASPTGATKLSSSFGGIRDATTTTASTASPSPAAAPATSTRSFWSRPSSLGLSFRRSQRPEHSEQGVSLSHSSLDLDRLTPRHHPATTSMSSASSTTPLKAPPVLTMDSTLLPVTPSTNSEERGGSGGGGRPSVGNSSLNSTQMSAKGYSREGGIEDPTTFLELSPRTPPRSSSLAGADPNGSAEQQILAPNRGPQLPAVSPLPLQIAEVKTPPRTPNASINHEPRPQNASTSEGTPEAGKHAMCSLPTTPVITASTSTPTASTLQCEPCEPPTTTTTESHASQLPATPPPVEKAGDKDKDKDSTPFHSVAMETTEFHVACLSPEQPPLPSAPPAPARVDVGTTTAGLCCCEVGCNTDIVSTAVSGQRYGSHTPAPPPPLEQRPQFATTAAAAAARSRSRALRLRKGSRAAEDGDVEGQRSKRACHE